MTSSDAKFQHMFEEAAEKLDSEALISGRLTIQADSLRNMPADVLAKLEPGPADRLLEIGCGTGLLLTPLAAHVKEAIGLDGERVLAKYRTSGVPANVTLIAGVWPTDQSIGTFDRILVYSTLHYRDDAESAHQFINACLEALRPGGALLLGDLPNRDARRRFGESPGGRAFDQEWNKQVERSRAAHAEFYDIFSRHGGMPRPYFNDAFVLDVLARARASGLEGYLLPQGKDLPFAHTREDILIRRRA